MAIIFRGFTRLSSTDRPYTSRTQTKTATRKNKSLTTFFVAVRHLSFSRGSFRVRATERGTEESECKQQIRNEQSDEHTFRRESGLSLLPCSPWARVEAASFAGRGDPRTDRRDEDDDAVRAASSAYPFPSAASSTSHSWPIIFTFVRGCPEFRYYSAASALLPSPVVAVLCLFLFRLVLFVCDAGLCLRRGILPVRPTEGGRG